MSRESYYDRIHDAELSRWQEEKRKLTEELNAMTLEEKVNILIKDYINRQTSRR